MEPKNVPNMTCLILGHNYYKDESLDHQSDSVICKACGTTANISNNGEFITDSKDTFIQKSMQKLFALKRRLYSHS